MTAVKQIETLNQINEGEFEHIFKVLFDSFSIKREYKSVSLVQKKNINNLLFSIFGKILGTSIG
jgi:hypothetical protein